MADSGVSVKVTGKPFIIRGVARPLMTVSGGSGWYWPLVAGSVSAMPSSYRIPWSGSMHACRTYGRRIPV